MRLTALLTAAAFLLAAGPALAQPKLVAATPAADATVTRPTTIALTFSEDLAAPLSGIDLVMTAMPGMANHKPMPIKGITPKAAGKALTIALPRPLPSGTYRLTWHAAGPDQRRVEGSYAFTVK
jgi:methionine-rich copper-binding protein CopC